jgi:hypothetical protein
MVLSLVLNGKRDPTRKHIASLSTFFEVDLAVVLGRRRAQNFRDRSTRRRDLKHVGDRRPGAGAAPLRQPGDRS